MEDKKTTILIIDDDPDVAAMLKHYLSLRHFSVLTAFRGEDALAVIEKEKVDLVILDIIMHGIHGLAVAKLIKERHPEIKIIVMTGYPDAGKQIEHEVHLEGLFFKPEGIQMLYHKLLAC